MSLVNSVFACIELALCGRAIRKTVVGSDPVVIVGHPRTGTTHLHYLLTLDEEAFYTCTTFDVGFPSSFLVFPARVREMLKAIMDVHAERIDLASLGFWRNGCGSASSDPESVHG